jgi:hypothetical protein
LAAAVVALASAAGFAAGETIRVVRMSVTGVLRFATPANLAINPDMRVFDADCDGVDDIVTRLSNGQVLVYLATASTDATAYEEVSFPAPPDLGALFRGNFDRDAFKELFGRVTGGVAVVNDAGGPAPGAATPVINDVTAINDPQGMTAADADGDGDDDLFVNIQAGADGNAAKCLVFQNNTPFGQNAGPGDFVLADTIALDPPPIVPQEFASVSAGLINGDVIIDLALVSQNAAKCVLMAGNGNGTFVPINPLTGAPIPGGPPSAGAIEMGSSPSKGFLEDLDGDGASDVIVLGGGVISVRFSNGNGTFGALVQTAAPGSAFLIFGDIDGNGTKDIVTLVEVFGAVSQWDSLGVIKVNLDRTLQATVLLPTIYQPRSAGFFRVHPDDPAGVLVGGAGRIALHRKVGGEIRSFRRIRDETGGGGVRDLVVGDLTGDGWRDVWFSTFGFGNRVLVNAADGSGLLGQTLIAGQGTSNAAPVAFVERPAIGRGALGFATNATNVFNIMAVNDAGTQLVYLVFPSIPDDVRDVSSIDFSGDGRVGLDDFVLLHLTGNPGISVLSQQANGSFGGTFTSFDLSASSPAEGWWARFDAFEDSFRKGVMVTGPGGAGMYVDTGSGFDFFSAFGSAFSGGVCVAAGDLNADGRTDVVVGRDLGSNAGAVTVAIQNAGGGPPTFAAPTTINVTGVPRSMDVGDLDNDGDADLAVVSDDGATTEMQRTTVLLNDGTGSFPAADVTEHPAGSSPSRVVLADLHNPVGTTRGSSATAGPEIVQGGRGPNAFAGVLVHENLVNFAPPPCDGDADGNGVVNFADVTSVLQFFGADYSPGTGPGDADHNGPVNFADVTRVLQFFGIACP